MINFTYGLYIHQYRTNILYTENRVHITAIHIWSRWVKLSSQQLSSLTLYLFQHLMNIYHLQCQICVRFYLWFASYWKALCVSYCPDWLTSMDYWEGNGTNFVSPNTWDWVHAILEHTFTVADEHISSTFQTSTNILKRYLDDNLLKFPYGKIIKAVTAMNTLRRNCTIYTSLLVGSTVHAVFHFK